MPVIATDSGIDHLITEAGGGILILGNRDQHLWHPEITAKSVREAVIRLRDNRNEAKEMGVKGRLEIVKNWQWEKFFPAWREFFRKGTSWLTSGCQTSIKCFSRATSRETPS